MRVQSDTDLAWVAWCALAMLLSMGPTGARAYELLGVRWPTREAIMHVGIVDTLGSDRAPSGPTWDAAFERAMLAWSDPTPFGFVIVDDSRPDPCLSSPTTTDGKNSIAFATAFCGTAFGATTVAVTRFTYIGASFVDVATVFNDLFAWDVYPGPLRGDGVVDFFGSRGTAGPARACPPAASGSR